MECLESIQRLEYPSVDVVVVDNGSRDQSIEMLETYAAGRISALSERLNVCSAGMPRAIIKQDVGDMGAATRVRDRQLKKGIAIVKNEKNYGFSEGNNIGIRYAMREFNPDYFLLLNNDTVVDSRMVSELVSVGERSDDAGILGPKTLFYDHPDVIQLTYNRVNLSRGTILLIGEGETDRGQHDEVADSDYVPGSCLLVKKKVVEDIGVLDPTFFCYWEETDYCFRAREAGYRILYCPKARVWHKVSRTAGGLGGFTTYYMTRNMFWFLVRHSTRKQYLSFLAYFLGFRFWLDMSVILKSDKRLTRILSNVKGVLDGLKAPRQGVYRI